MRRSCACFSIVRGLDRKVHFIDQTTVFLLEQARDIAIFTDDRKSVQHVIGYKVAHLLPFAFQRKSVQLAADVLKAVAFKNGEVSTGGRVKGDPAPGLRFLISDGGLVGSGNYEATSDQGYVARIAGRRVGLPRIGWV